jgi:hypothetical protein
MIPLLINQSNISRDFSLQLLKCLADSDLVHLPYINGYGVYRHFLYLSFTKFPLYVVAVSYIVSSGFFLAIVEMSSGFRSSCYWTDWNWANTEYICIGLVFAVLAQ